MANKSRNEAQSIAINREDPGKSMAEVRTLIESERNRTLYEWNDTRADYPDVCVHELFERQAARIPDATAVVFQGQQLSYRDLNQRANQLGHYLRKRGIGPELLVGVSMERSPEMLVGLLGIWKAGGAYIPMDPTYPKERLSFMVKDSAAQLLLTTNKHKHLFASTPDKTILLDSDWPVIAEESAGNPQSGAVPSNLAYVMYTSGSTGEPKGAMILHSGLVNYLCWAIRAYAVEEGGSVPVHSSISFDLTVTSLYTPLLAGGQVDLLPEDVGAQNLLAALRQRKNRSLVKITPAHLELLSQLLKPDQAVGMTKTFVIGGENLLAESLHLWRDFAPGTRLINEYGPTETVVGCCVYEVREDDPRRGSVPIGRPVANTQLYVLDPDMNPVPPGVMGELYIGGAGVARGYLNRPELTRQRFLADPFSGRPGARLYRTGDLARYRPDGTLEFLGRIDDQVKVRGYRIELGEIEATLADHSGLKSCVVLAREDEPGDKQLVGYVVPSENESPTVEELRQFLRQRLPDYMVPAQFVFLKSFTLTPNGKIDRKALPAPSKRQREAGELVAPRDPLEQVLAGLSGDTTDREALPTPSYENRQPARDFVRPRTETERSLAAIWTALLKVESIGVNDDFFDLGGHSLLAIRLVSRIRDVFGVELPLATLFQAPTIADLAGLLRKEDWVPSWASLVPMRSEGTKPPFFLMHAHGGNVLEYHALVNRLEPDQPVYAFQARGLDGHVVKGTSVEEMASAYLDELRKFQPEGPYYLGGFCLGGLLALEAAQQLTAAGQEVALVVMIQSIQPESMGFRPGTTVFHRWWYRATERIDLELENLSYRGKGYIGERCRHLWNRVRARTAIAFDNMSHKGAPDPSRLSMHKILEGLAMEHQKAVSKYVPRPYGGDVLLFRASKQLSGLMADEYLGWKRVLQGNLDVCEAPGHQQNLLLEPNVPRLAQELTTRLKAAQHRHRSTPDLR
ncbi:MAG: amino acid adenylation domain-containing protein [Acidobacteriia bacterium]|nr:amino acid adenylation domain-containing protein [Terriglobia bacterium]